MRTRNLPTILMLVLMLLLQASPAGAAKQLKARKAPKTSGPVEKSARGCETQTVRAEGRMIARVEACVFFFTFDPFSEVDVIRDYGVAWVQLTFDAGKGLCADEVGVTVEFPEGTEIHRVEPERAIVGTRAQRANVRLDATAGDFALENGSVSQKFTAIPASLRSETDARRATILWNGHTGTKIAVVGGAEVSWSMLSPLEEFDFLPGPIRMTQC